MTTNLYIDKQGPLVSLRPEKLSDGSAVWNLHLRGGDVIGCVSERRGEEGLLLIAKGLELAAGQPPLIL